MKIINATLIDDSLVTIAIEHGQIAAVDRQSSQLPSPPSVISSRQPLWEAVDLTSTEAGATVDAAGALILPAMTDIHIHSRDPGFPEKETWESVAAAAHKGGVCAVADMPNTNPPTMFAQDLRDKAERARRAHLDVGLYLGVGARNIAHLAEALRLDDVPICGLKVYYGQSTGELMYDDLAALARALPTDRATFLSFHSEDQCCIDDNVARLGWPNDELDYAAFRRHSELRSSEAAHRSTQTILDWSIDHKVGVHIAHLSTPREVELIGEARARGARVTCEVAPHHLIFSIEDYPRLGPFLKVNPPVRSHDEVVQLRRYVAEGLIDIFATDHAPHTLAEKSRPMSKCPSGMPALEFFTPLLLHVADLCGFPRQRAVAMGSALPQKLCPIGRSGQIAPGFDANLIMVRSGTFSVTSDKIKAKCGWSPYEGMQLPGEVVATWIRGRRVYCADH